MRVLTKLTGTSPLIMHNNQTADPLNEYAVEIKKITSKRKKTDSDHLEIRRLEFLAGLYMDEYGPIVPARCIKGMMIDGGKNRKNGEKVRRGVWVESDARLDYSGPRGAQEMYHGGFAWSTQAGNQQKNTIIRTRPRFDEWKVTFSFEFAESIIGLQELTDAMEWASKFVGLLDAKRIGFGRFTVDILETVEVGELFSVEVSV